MALFADGFPSVFGRKKQTDPAFVASHSGRMDNHDRGVPDWILKVPIDVAQIMERDKITVRTPQEVLWTMKTGIYAARSKSPGLLFPTPFQDFVDRPEYFFGSALVGGASCLEIDPEKRLDSVAARKHTWFSMKPITTSLALAKYNIQFPYDV
eukprot:TRINITY_DN17208_c0_g1_i7.p1 TRINITY_DN17208_c0_g1~~TRINITY_DN17208_c0_g1_i7.p1  ORF type:complete len:153 (+),score=24.06 TRINITY_DN17208_c0_g1_i7:55-513(+)